jgi:hypothetical protein
MATYKPGERVIWFQQGDPRGAVSGVIRLGAKRVLIDAPPQIGGTKPVWVRPETLRPAASDSREAQP